MHPLSGVPVEFIILPYLGPVIGKTHSFLAENKVIKRYNSYKRESVEMMEFVLADALKEDEDLDLDLDLELECSG